MIAIRNCSTAAFVAVVAAMSIPVITGVPAEAGDAGGPSATGATKAAFELPVMPTASPFSTDSLDPEVKEQLEEQWGVRVIGLRIAANSYMLDFRFHVVDADKALPLFDSRTKPYVLVPKSNARLPVPMGAKVGAFRPTNRGRNITAGRNYYMMFGNPDQHVAVGERVSIVIGDFRVDDLLVDG